jgi:hypothetical protein
VPVKNAATLSEATQPVTLSEAKGLR